MNIDLVYLWVDGNDIAWQNKRNACIGKPVEHSGVNCEGRYANNDELMYSLRSIEKYAPWINRIFIVTDNQTPSWINKNNPKIKVIDHKDIMPEVCLPCFNSSLIEHFLYKIPGLSEYFLYSNDDMYINKPVQPSDFFTESGLPIIRLNRRPLRKLTFFFKEKILGKQLSNYNQIVNNAAILVEKKYGIFFSGKAHHNIDSYSKSEFEHIEEVFSKEIKETYTNHVRCKNDIQRSLLSYAALAEKKAYLKYVTQKTSFRFHIHKEKHYAKLEKYNPTFFCMNDSEYANDNDRKRAKAYLEKRFPEKSQFEK